MAREILTETGRELAHTGLHVLIESRDYVFDFFSLYGFIMRIRIAPDRGR